MRRTSLLLCVLVLLLAACNLPQAAPAASESAPPPAAAPDIGDEARIQTAVAASLTAQAALAPVSSSTPPPTVSQAPCNRAGFISENFIDGTEVTPNLTFVKTWRLQNDGSCTWTSGYQLIFYAGDQMGAPSSISLTGVTVPPGAQIDISVQLKSPGTPGTYQGDFMLKASDGQVFGIGVGAGGRFWVNVVVKQSVMITIPPLLLLTKLPFIIVTIPGP